LFLTNLQRRSTSIDNNQIARPCRLPMDIPNEPCYLLCNVQRKRDVDKSRRCCRARASENNRKAKFYSMTKSGLKQLARETEDWERISGVIGRVLRLAGQKS
jgi:predicted RNA polymerase sigma factor